MRATVLPEIETDRGEEARYYSISFCSPKQRGGMKRRGVIKCVGALDEIEFLISFLFRESEK